jgi:hypothetical protein
MSILACLVLLLTASSPLLDVEDSIQRGGTAVYTVSLESGKAYWVVLSSLAESTNLDIVVASFEMDLDHFMNLPYRQDFLYALEHSIIAGMQEGDESFTLQTPHTGPVHIVVHDSGGNGGGFTLVIH